MRDSLEFDEFYAATSRRVLGQVYAMTGDIGAAEDAVAEAYMKAWQRWAHLRRYEVPEAWVRTVATRTAVSGWRKARNRLTAHRRAQEPDAYLHLGPDHVALVEALRTVPSNLRQAVVLFYIADLSVAEIAAEMGAAEGTVKSWLSRARQMLRVRLDDASSVGSEGRS